MKNSNIEWTDHTFNPWIGCTKVSPGCDHCYAEARMDKRLHKVQWGPGQPRQRTSEKYWKDPLDWNKEAAAGDFVECSGCGRRGRASTWEKDIHKHNPEALTCCPDRKLVPVRPRVFCASLSDVFDNEADPEWRADLFDLIRETPHLDWLLLTKRIGNAKTMIEAYMAQADIGYVPEFTLWPWPNVWIGATIVNQAEADRDIPKLLAVPAAKRFLSMEPLLGPVDLTDIVVRHEGGTEDHFSALFDPDDDEAENFPYLNWVIVGGESGPGARPMHPDWARSLRDQCQAAGVPFLFKQWGEWLPGQNDVHPNADGRRVAHHQDGRWGPTNTKVNASNYLSWDASGMVHHGSLANDTTGFRAQVWAERIGKKAAGRMLDGRTWDEVPA